MILKTKAAKLAAGLVGFAFVFSLFVTPVATKAQTNTELQAMINTLLAQIASLQGSIGSTGGSMMMSHTFGADLTVGSQGADVVALQQMLVTKGFLTIPAGVAMGYFGELTRSALATFQSANGISPASGYFGPITRTKVNAMMMVTGTTPGTTSYPAGCTSSVGYSSTTGMSCAGSTYPAGCTSSVGYSSTTGMSCAGSTGTTNPSTGALRGGAGDVTVTERNTGTHDEVLEGDEEVKVLGFEVEAEGGDVMVTSVRVEFKHEGSGSRRFNRYVDEVQIMNGNQVVGSADVSAFSESSNVYSRNIPVSGVIVREDATLRLHVAVTAVRNVDSNDLGEDWQVALGQIRFEDATGAILTDNTGDGIDGDITETFSFEDLQSSGDIELTVSEDNESVNDARTVQVDDSRDTNDVEILSFTIEAKGSDMFINEIPFTITSTGAGVTEIANDFRLMMNGEEVGRASIDAPASGATGFASNTDMTRTITITDLDDDDVMIDEGDEVTFVLVADINDIDGAFGNGDTFSVALDSDDVDAEDENGDIVEDLSGSADSGPLTFASSGIMLAAGRSDSVERVYNLDTTSSDDQGRYVINFDVTAFKNDAYVALTAASSTSSATPSTAGAYVYVESTNDNDVAVGTSTITTTLELDGSQSSGVSQSGNYVRINKGRTAHLTLTVNYDAATSGTYRAQLYAVNFAGTAVAGTSQHLATPTEDYQSPSVQVLN